jgi:hypothetical protein
MPSELPASGVNIGCGLDWALGRPDAFGTGFVSRRLAISLAGGFDICRFPFHAEGSGVL